MTEKQKTSRTTKCISLLLSILMLFSSFPLLNVQVNATEVQDDPNGTTVMSSPAYAWGWLYNVGDTINGYKVKAWTYNSRDDKGGSTYRQQDFTPSTRKCLRFYHTTVGNKLYPMFCIEPVVELHGADGQTVFIDSRDAFTRLTLNQKELIGAIIYYSGVSEIEANGVTAQSIGNIPDDYLAKYAATQILIWEVVSGMRYGYLNDETNNANVGKRRDGAIQSDIIYGCRRFASDDTNFEHPISKTEQTQKFKDAYNSIINNAIFAVKKPIVLNTNKITLAYDSSQNKYVGSINTSTMTNGLSLSDYSLSSNNGNVKATVSGTIIKLESTKANQKAKITLTPKKDNKPFTDGTAKICIYQNVENSNKKWQTQIRPMEKKKTDPPEIEVTVPNAATMEIEKKFYLSNGDGVERNAGTSTAYFAVTNSKGKYVKVSGTNPLNYTYNGVSDSLTNNCKIKLAKENNKFIFRIKNLPIDTYEVQEQDTQSGYLVDNTKYVVKANGQYVCKQTIKNFSNYIQINKQWIFPKGIGEEEPDKVEVHIYKGTDDTTPEEFICLNAAQGWYRPATSDDKAADKITELKLGTTSKNIFIYALPNRETTTWVVREARTSTLLNKFTSNAYDADLSHNIPAKNITLEMKKNEKSKTANLKNQGAANNSIKVKKQITDGSSSASNIQTMYSSYKGYIQIKDTNTYLKLNGQNGSYTMVGTSESLTNDCKFSLNSNHECTISEIPDGSYIVYEDPASLAANWRIVKGQETATLNGGVNGKTIEVTHKNEYVLEDLVITKEVKNTKGTVQTSTPSGILFYITQNGQIIDLLQTGTNEYKVYEYDSILDNYSVPDTYIMDHFGGNVYSIRKKQVNTTYGTYTTKSIYDNNPTRENNEPVDIYQIIGSRRNLIGTTNTYNVGVGFDLSPNYKNSYIYVGGVGAFSLNDDMSPRIKTKYARLMSSYGDSITIKGLEKNKQYIIYEIVPDNVFVPTIQNSTVTKPARTITLTNTNHIVKFTNALNKRPLTINKKSFDKDVLGVEFEITREYKNSAGTIVKDNSFKQIVKTNKITTDSTISNTIGSVTVDLDTYYLDKANKKLYAYTYRIKEVSKNQESMAYYVTQTKVWDANPNNPPTSVEFINTPITGNLKIVKKMKKIDTGKEVVFPNVKFTIKSDIPSSLVSLYTNIYEVNVIQSEEYTTDANGEINISNLPVVYYTSNGGKKQITYTIKEQTTNGINDSFVLSEDETVTLKYPVSKSTVQAARQTQTVKMINVPKTGSIELTKIDANTKKPVEGCTFNITLGGEPYTVHHIVYDENGNETERIDTTSMIEDSPGHYILNNVPLGSYTITELRKSGYLNLKSSSKVVSLTKTNPIIFLYTDSEKKLSYTSTQYDDNENPYVVENTPITQPVQVTKTDKQGNIITYPGAIFNVYEDTNNNGSYDAPTETTDGDKIIDTLEFDTTDNLYKSTKELGVGTYFLQETRAPEGFTPDTTITKITVADKPSSSGTPIKIQKKNGKIYGYFRATKIDSQTKELLAGATFVLYKDENKNGKYDAGDTVAKMYDSNNNWAEADAVVQGYSGSNKGKYLLPTGYRLRYGQYILVETSPPDGHKLNAVNEYPFAITDASRVDVYLSTIDTMNSNEIEDDKIPNAPIETTIIIKKKNSSGAVLKNIEFALYDNSGNLTKQIVGEKTLKRQYNETTEQYELVYDESTISYVDQKKLTNTSGVAKFEGVRCGKYTLKETFPSNYLANATYSYTDPVTNTTKTGHLTASGLALDITKEWDGKSITINVTNTPTESKLFKESPDDGVVSNVTFTIRKQGTTTVLYTRKTNANGEIDISDIPAGKYTAREENVPDNKIAFPAEQNFEIKNNQTTTLLFTNKIKKANITILKLREGTATPVNGCKFALYRKGTNGAADELIEEVTTKSTGKAAFQTVPYGDYYIKETFVPKGYALLNTQWDISKSDFSATEEVTTFPLTIENSPQKLTFKLHKYNSDNNASIKNAEFTLYRKSDDAVVQVKKTNSSGDLSFENLEYDDYYVKETAAPTGYIKVDTIWNITKNNFTRNEPITVMNTVNVAEPPQKISIKVIKNDASSNTPVKDAKFAIYNSSNTKLQEITTNANGEATFDNQPYGKYTIKETYAPPGYVKNTTVWNITEADFTEQVALSTKEIPVTEPNQKIQIKVNKTDDTNTPVANATFYLYKADGTRTSIKATTNSEGVATFPAMYYSEFANTNYYIQEYSAPKNYVINNTKFNITKQDFQANVENTVKTIPVSEKRKHIAVKIIKTDSETNVPIKGAVFGLYRNSDSTLIEQITTNANGEATFSEQLYDTYFVKEISVPPAYTKLTTKWTITKATDFAPNEEHIQKTIEVSEPSRKIRVKINKKDAKTNTPIKNAVFGLYKKVNNSLVESKKTDVNGELTFSDIKYADLDPTGYYVQEISVPNGYEKLSTKWDVTKADFTEAVNIEYTAKNIEVSEPVQKIRISVKKSKEGTTTPIAGATFGLYKKSDNSLLSSKTTNSSGKLTFPDQDYDNYYVKEISAPEGYILNTTVWNVTKADFTKDIALTLKELPVTEKEQTVQISVYKKESTKKTAIPGAVLGLFKGTNTTPIETKTTNSSGKVTFSKLAYTDVKNNNYYIKEITAPNGYVKVDDEIPITINDFTPGLENTVTNKELLEPKKYIVVKIHKMRSDNTSVPIPGAKFTLYRTSDNAAIATKTTNASGNIEFAKIAYDDYYVKETYVPDGYIINPDTWVITKANDFTENIEVAVKQIDVPETSQKIKISVKKKNIETNTPIQGVTFRLFNANTNVAIETKTTNASGNLTFTTQEYGNYYVKEISCPPAYVCNTNSRWDVTTNDFTANTELTSKTITVTNPPKKLTVEVYKVKDGTTIPVPGAKFGLYKKSDNSKVAEAITEDNGKGAFPEQLYDEEGYTLKEISVPNGYALLTTTWDITAEDFEANEPHIVKRINVSEPEQKIRVTVVKKDSATNDPIPGVKFALYKESSDGSADVKIQEKTTNNAGEITFADQPYDNYYLKETYTPQEYVSPAADKRWNITTDMFTANVALTPKTVTIKNTKKKLTVELIKTDRSTGQTIPIKDAVFTLYKKADNSEIESKTTNSNGKLTFTAREYGEYYVKETQAPPGYAKIDDVWNITLDDFAPNKSSIKKTINTIDPPQKIDISVNKTIKNTSTPLPGAVFSLYKKDGTLIESKTTNNNGKISFTRQTYGEYYVKETEAPEGCACLDTTWNITLNDFTPNEEISAKHISAADEPQTISVKLFKYESVNNTRQPVKDAKFTLYRKSDNSAIETKTTAANGYLTFSTQPYGNYYVKETEAPPGYALNNSIWNVNAGSLRASFPVTQKVLSTTLYVDERQQNINIKVIKKDSDTHEPIEGAVFSLYTKDTDTLVESITTGSNGEATFQNQPYGEYYIKETYVPPKYVKPEGIVAEVTLNDFTTGQAISNKAINLENKSKKTIIKMHKIDEETGAPIKNAKFTLYNKDTNTAIETKTTDANGYAAFTGQTYGNYYVKETTAPPNYVIIKTEYDILTDTFTVNQEIIYKNIEVREPLQKINVSIKKTEEGTTTPIENAVFAMYRKSDNIKVDEQSTNTEGEITFAAQPYGKYYIKEISTPAQYVLLTDQWEIDESDFDQNLELSTKSINITNSPVKIKISVHKTDDENNPISGAKFGLYAGDGQLKSTKTTNASGNINFPQQTFGTYYVREISVPAGYVLDSETKHWITPDDFGANVAISTKPINVTNDRMKIKINVKKNDAEDNSSVQDAVFGLYNKSDDSEIERQTTDAKGELTFSDQVYGNYYIKEISVPDKYILLSTKWDVTTSDFTANQKLSVKDVTVSEPVKKLKINLMKYDTEKGKTVKLKGAVFSLYRKGETQSIKSVTTDTRGEASFGTQLYGEYYIKEIKAPEGYILDTTVYNITLDMFTDDETTIPVHTVEAGNTEEKIQIAISKTEKGTTIPIKDAVFGIYKKTGSTETEIERETTDDAGKLSFASIGYAEIKNNSYYVKEISVPDKYVLLTGDEGKWDITTDDFTVNTATTVKNIEVEEPVKMISPKLTKYNGTITNRVKGATFSIYAKGSTEAIESKTTDNNGELTFSNQPYGEYYIKETKAPAGFALLEGQWDITLADFDNNEVSIKQILVDETNQEIEIKILKQKTGTNIPVPNATFGLYKTSDNTKLDEKITNAQGKLTFSKQPYGSYYVKELSVPDGYVLLTGDAGKWSVTENDFEIGQPLSTKEITVQEPVKKIRLTVNKTKEGTTEPIQGAKFGIYAENSTMPIEIKTTNASGRLTFSDQEYGSYYIKETYVPDGYVLLDTIWQINTSDFGDAELSTKTINVSEPYYEINVIKTSSDGNVADIAFEVTKQNDASFQKQTLDTDANGNINIQDISAGTYIIKEIVPDGYVCNSQNPQTVTLSAAAPHGTVRFSNTKMIPVKIIKSSDDNIVNGMQFTIEGIDGTNYTKTTMTTATIDNQPGVIATNLKAGKYRITEINRPARYKSDSSQTQDITITDQDNNKVVYVYNRLTETGFTINKTELFTNEPVKDAVFVIKQKNTTNEWTVTTDASGHADLALTYGEYTYQETSVPAGYKLDTTVYSFSINDNNGYTANVTNIGIGSFRIKKTDSYTNLPMKNVTFRLRNVDNSYNKTAVTGDDGYAVFNNLEFGEYLYSEISAPEGYEFSNAETKVTINTNTAPVTVNRTNRPFGEFSIAKIDAKTKQPIKNVTFRLRNTDSSYDRTVTTGDNGIAQFQNLDLGTYFYSETAAPEGYIIDRTEREITISSAGESKTITVENTGTGSLELQKVDSNSKQPISGVKFRLRNADKSYDVTYVTEANGIVTFENLPYGTYFYSEIEAPEGYIFDGSEHEIQITTNGQVIRPDPIENTGTGSLEITKIDAESNESIADVTFRLRNSDNSYNKTVKTGIDGIAKFNNIPYGTYLYSEIDAPEGYIIDSTERSVTITENGQVIRPAAITNPGTGSLVLKKIDASTKQPIKNVTFRLRGKNNGYDETKTTGNTGIVTFDNLVYGTYFYSETAAPDGYIFSTDETEIHINQNNQIIEPEPIENIGVGSIALKKTDISTGDPIPNVNFKIRNANDEVIFEGKTDANGNLTFSDLIYGKYTYQETNAPKGYIVNDDKIPFEIKTNGEIIRANVKNTGTGKIVLTKTDVSTGETLPECGIEITDMNGKVLMRGETNADGVIEFDALPYGKYYYREYKAPKNYLLDDTFHPFEIKTNGEIIRATLTDRLFDSPDTSDRGKMPMHTEQAVIFFIGFTITAAAYTKCKKTKKKIKS